jgi:hypothetical protein
MTPLLFALALAATDAAPAQQPTTVAPATVPGAKAPSTSKPNSEKLVCRSEEVAGSRVRNRRCQTQAEWDQQEEQVHQYFQDASDHGGLNGVNPNPMAGH